MSLYSSGIGTSAMAAALSIISLVIFFAPSACACAHKSPGNSVPASPIAEHVFMKFRRCSIRFLQSFVRSRAILQPTIGSSAHLLQGDFLSDCFLSPDHSDHYFLAFGVGIAQSLVINGVVYFPSGVLNQHIAGFEACLFCGTATGHFCKFHTTVFLPVIRLDTKIGRKRVGMTQSN